MSVQIEKIRIKIGEKELDLSIEEAKELQSVLNDLFQKKEEIMLVEKEVYHHYVYPIWVTHTWPEYPYKRWDVYYTSDNTNTLHIER